MQDNFKTQAFGFNKKEVIDYIFALTSEKEQTEAGLSQKIAELNEQVETLTANINRLEGENSELNEQVMELKTELAASNEQNSLLFEEINESRRKILDNEREFNIKNEQISKLISENEIYAEKCADYSKIAQDVGKTILDAKHIASGIINKANDEAVHIRENTEKTVSDALFEINETNSELDVLKRNFDDMIRVFENRIKTVEQNLSSVSSSLGNVGKSVKSIETAENQFEDGEEKDAEQTAVEFF